MLLPYRQMSSFEFLRINDISSILTPYAIAFRYTGDVIEPYPEDAYQALRLAVEVFDFVLYKKLLFISINRE